MNSKIKLLIIIFSCLIIISTIFGIVSYSNFLNRDFNIKIITDKTDIRTDELLSLSVISPGSDANITWDLGNGDSKYGEFISYSYNQSKIFDIIVVVDWNGVTKEDNMTMIVKNQDFYEHYYGEGFQNLNPISMTGRGSAGIILPGITDPEVEISLNLQNAIGNIQIDIRLFDPVSGENELINMENIMGNNNDINFDYTIERGELPEIDTLKNIQVNFIINNGKCNSWNNEIKVTY